MVPRSPETGQSAACVVSEGGVWSDAVGTVPFGIDASMGVPFLDETPTVARLPALRLLYLLASGCWFAGLHFPLPLWLKCFDIGAGKRRYA